jgi:signal transduction histidine kinase
MMRLRSGRSLLSVLFFSIAGVALSIYLLMQFLIPDEPDRSIPLADRLTASYFLDTTRDSGVPVAVFLVLVMATIWIVLQLTLSPVRKLSEHARRIGPANLDERLPAAEAPTEIAPLVEAFNTSLDRLEDAWKAQRAFSANAAHELRTPLAALRAHVESLLPAQHRGEAANEFDRLARIISQLLVLSEGEHGPLRRTCPFDLVEIAKTATSGTGERMVENVR